MVVVTCPNCLSKFKVKPEPDKGPGFIKCASCSHVFVVNPELMKGGKERDAAQTTEFLPELSFIEPPRDVEDESFTALQTSPVGDTPEGARRRGKQAVLVVGSTDEVHPIEKFKTTFGRRNADVTLNDPDVSRQHAVVERYDEKFLLKDLESTNGTFLNGQRISIDFLEDGDVIRMGKTVIRFQLR